MPAFYFKFYDMRIGFDAKRAFLNQAGLGNYGRNTLSALQKYYPRHDYILYTPEIKTDLFKEYPLFENVAPDNFFTRLFKSYWRHYSISKRMESDKLDLFHGLSNELPAGIHRVKIPTVVTIHDLIFMNFPLWYKRVDRTIYLKKVKYACDTASKIIAISNHTRTDLVNQLQIDPQRIEVIYQSISERYYFHSVKDQIDDLLAKYNLPRQYILTVGTIEPRKNHLAVLKAINRLDLDMPYVIIGKSTAYKAELVEFINMNRLTNQVYFLHDVPDIDLPALYKQAICMVYLSHYEGFGLPVVEAMASGCPVIASSVSCLPEIGAEAAMYCEPDDETSLGEMLIKMASDNELRNNLSQLGKRRSQFFHPEERVNALMELYQKLINQ
jgi:glycosyltransferase involved in cell wall biosynthesis